MAEVRALLRRQDGAELGLALRRVHGPVGQPQLPADANAVRVADHRPRHPVEVAQQEICRLPAHAGDLQKLLHAVRNPSAVVPQQGLAGQDDVPRLMLIKAAGVDHFLHLGHVRSGEGLQ